MGGRGRWGNDDTRSEVLRRGKSVSVSVCHTYKGKITNKDKIYVRIRTKLPIRTKFTKQGKITRNL